MLVKIKLLKLKKKDLDREQKTTHSAKPFRDYILGYEFFF